MTTLDKLVGMAPPRHSNGRFCCADDAADRFASKCEPVPESGCWLWTGAMRGDGYGGFKISAGRTVSAHRASWEIHRGPIPEGAYVLHKCDVALCVNPDHLYLGDHQDNMDDRTRRGRNINYSGEAHPCAKISAADVREMRALSANGHTHQELAERFGISKGQAGRIVRGDTWTDA